MNDLKENLKEKINIAAYFLSQKNLPYDTLCWILAEKQLFIQTNYKNAPVDMIRQKAAEIFFTSIPYDILCWLIAELDILIKNKINKPNFFDI